MRFFYVFHRIARAHSKGNYMKIDLAILGRQYELHAAEYEAAALRAMRSGWYIMGPELAAFEKEFAAYTGAQYAVGLNSGLDALILSVAALGIGAGDEVIVRKAPLPAKIVKFDDKNYYQTIRTKLLYNA